ncbi:hypothetical protein HPP92_002238 [Vanilla planifolia]|uniref:Uncharacterized protein n=1 Tax=Vanilla planifolia TaxID=51239 RepID=A0A835S4Y5_VANPL|nr:hypothetical protein HPP92_002238 [Vanilla planifolia]
MELRHTRITFQTQHSLCRPLPIELSGEIAGGMAATRLHDPPENLRFGGWRSRGELGEHDDHHLPLRQSHRWEYQTRREKPRVLRKSLRSSVVAGHDVLYG